jgi:hypothetical protein
MTATYSTDLQVLSYDAHATELLFDGTDGKYNDSGSFDRHRVVVKSIIDISLDQRDPRSYGIVGSVQFVNVEVYGVLAMAYRENSSTAGERDRFWSLAQEYQKMFERSLENVKASGYAEQEETEANEVYGNSIEFERS